MPIKPKPVRVLGEASSIPLYEEPIHDIKFDKDGDGQKPGLEEESLEKSQRPEIVEETEYKDANTAQQSLRMALLNFKFDSLIIRPRKLMNMKMGVWLEDKQRRLQLPR